MKTDIHFE